MTDDIQIHVYRTMPQRYGHIADQVNVAMRHSNKPCVGDGRDEGSPCPRHERTIRVVDRYLRIRAKSKRK